MREHLVAWATDCRVRGAVDVVDGRLSDQLNEGALLTFHGATLESLEDGHAVTVDELEVEHRELDLVAVEGRRGDPARRLRTVEELVELQLGPFRVTGNVHRAPSAQPLAALTRWTRFIPVTDAVVAVSGRGGDPLRLDVVLVNRERIEHSEPLAVIPIRPDESWPQPSVGDQLPGGGSVTDGEPMVGDGAAPPRAPD